MEKEKPDLESEIFETVMSILLYNNPEQDRYQLLNKAKIETKRLIKRQRFEEEEEPVEEDTQQYTTR